MYNIGRVALPFYKSISGFLLQLASFTSQAEKAKEKNKCKSQSWCWDRNPNAFFTRCVWFPMLCWIPSTVFHTGTHIKKTNNLNPLFHAYKKTCDKYTPVIPSLEQGWFGKETKTGEKETLPCFLHLKMKKCIENFKTWMKALQLYIYIFNQTYTYTHTTLEISHKNNPNKILYL